MLRISSDTTSRRQRSKRSWRVQVRTGLAPELRGLRSVSLLSAARVKRVLDHYGSQSEEAAIAEDDAAYEQKDRTLMEVPNELVPVVGELIAKRRQVS